LSPFHADIESIGDRYQFQTKLDVDKFTTALNLNMDSPNRDQNPFIAGAIFFYIQSPEVQPLEQERVLALEQEFLSYRSILSSYGHHIQRLNCIVDGGSGMEDVINENQALIMLTSYLNLVPNLKILEISSTWEVSGYGLNLEALPPLPTLDKLEYLSLGEWIDWDIKSVIIRKYGNQLTTLRLDMNCEGEFEVEEFNNLLPNLKRLCVNGIYPSFLTKLAAVNWPLEVVQFKGFEVQQGNAQELLIQAISNFGQSLTQLVLMSDLTRITCETDSTCEREETTKKLAEEEEGILMHKLETLISYVDNMEAPWFMDDFILTKKCENIQEMYFLTNYPDFEPHMEAAKPAFEWLPNLKKIVFWREPQSDEENLERAVLTRKSATSNVKC